MPRNRRLVFGNLILLVFLFGANSAFAKDFIHPGLLQGDGDFERIRGNLDREPWKSGWEKLTSDPLAQLSVVPRPAATIRRGAADGDPNPQNYAQLFRDAAAAYQLGLRWRISGDVRYADKAVEVLNAWGYTLKELDTKPSDSRLASGIYGCQLANAGEIMRNYPGWKRGDFAQFQSMMKSVFLPVVDDFLLRHNGQSEIHYWTNWDAANIGAKLAIGVLCDDRAVYDEAIEYYKTGRGMGSIEHAVVFVSPDGLGQWEESGRDQPHSILGVGLLGTVCEMAWHQGDDLYGYDNNRLLAGAEYVAKYNLGLDVPFKPYQGTYGMLYRISPQGRGELRPVWEMIFNHYVKLKGVPAPYVEQMAAKVRPEGGGGEYGPNSGGFDALGFGTLLYSLDSTGRGSGTVPRGN